MKEQNKIDFYNYNNFEIVEGECSHNFPIHIHKHPCFGMITKGFVNFIIGGKKLLLKAGNIYFVPPYNPHTLSSVNGGVYGYITICLKNYNVQPFKEDYIKEALEYIKNFPRFTLETLSNAVYVSKFHLLRKFKEETGLTPYQYYLGEKIKKISQGLLSHIALTDLAFDFGFSDESHLCNLFRKYVGITPLQFVSSFKCL